MSVDLNPSDVAAWMREQARRFDGMADQIENTFKTSHSVASAVGGQSVPLADRIRKLLADGKARRAPDIARELGLPASQVRAAVAKNGLLARNKRGWITLAESKGGDCQ